MPFAAPTTSPCFGFPANRGSSFGGISFGDATTAIHGANSGRTADPSLNPAQAGLADASARLGKGATSMVTSVDIAEIAPEKWRAHAANPDREP